MSFSKLTIRDVPLDNQTVLVRVDYNVPLTCDGKIKDDFRIRSSLPTLNYLINRGCKLVLISHLGRPDGKVNPAFSLEPVALRLSQLINTQVRFVDQTIGDKVYQAVKKAPKNSITLLENLRFSPKEEADDEGFAKQLIQSSGAKYFVQDGFGVVHRAHASTDAITMFSPSVAGLLLEREYKTLTAAMENPKRPLIAVIGGAKVSDKVAIIERFIDVADKIIIGGALANNFLAYNGKSVGASSVEPSQVEVIQRIYNAVRAKKGDNVDDFLILPTDLAVAMTRDESADRKIVSVDEVADNELALDIGDDSIERMANEVKSAGTVIWNGTLGLAELPNFAHGSARLALALATQPETTSIIGGGDTADFVLNWSGNKGKGFSLVSTGGGASLELLAGNQLPGVESLLDAGHQIEYTNSNKHK
jgi:phosphoglycerate kinase